VLDSALSVLRQGRNAARLLEGLWVTLEISLVSVLLSMILGVMLGFLMTSKRPVWRVSTRAYLELMRLIPILVLLFIFYYTLDRNWGISLEAKTVAYFVFTLWGTAEMGDLVRGAITSLPVHQRESGRAIGLSEAQINRYIIVPQAVRRLIPGVINLTTRMIKTTPFVFFINVPELMKVGQQIVEVSGRTNQMVSFWIYGLIFFIYFFVCYPISLFSVYLEKKWSN